MTGGGEFVLDRVLDAVGKFTEAALETAKSEHLAPDAVLGLCIRSAARSAESAGTTREGELSTVDIDHLVAALIQSAAASIVALNLLHAQGAKFPEVSVQVTDARRRVLS